MARLGRVHDVQRLACGLEDLGMSRHRSGKLHSNNNLMHFQKYVLLHKLGVRVAMEAVPGVTPGRSHTDP